ncbi:MAG: VWA domain-containing protein [wastewater metagenome]|nr:VWA domain-containing protein [Candidatus Brocadia sp.]MCF6158981.1 VWA domain-containing protein [Candidatus Loosdrechtia aerotolerans]
MRKIYLLASFLTASMTIFTGCAQLKSFKKPIGPLETFVPQNLDAEFQDVEYVPKIKSFVIILDASASMEDAFAGAVNNGHPKFTVAKDILTRMNNTLPEIDINSALVTFGHGFFKPLDRTFIVYELTKHSRDLFENELNGITIPEGSSPAGNAIKDATNLLLTSGGQNAVILVSDGEQLIGSPLEKAQDLKEMYGDRVCLYTIFVGNTAEGEKALRELAREVQCGFSVTADEIASSDNMADFVRKVFLTAIPKQVSDSDGDGVYDKDDECPDTPKGAIVDSRGCWVVKGVTFDYKKWDIKEEFDSNLSNIVDVLQKNPDMHIRIEGHTDNIGSMEYNIDLSQKRAQAVKNYLVGKGIHESRVSTVGFGYKKPIAPNDTEEGRSLNRRAEIVPIK